MRIVPFVLAAVSSFPLLSTLVRAEVRVVSATTGPYHTVQSAIDAANDGDLVLIRGGLYAAFTLVDKAVDIVGDGGSSTGIRGTCRIERVPAHHSVVVERITFASVVPHASAVELDSNDGSVRFQECQLSGKFVLPGGTAAHITKSHNVVFVECSLEGGDAEDAPSPGCGAVSGATGVLADRSQIGLYDCTVRGGNGGADAPDFPNDACGVGGAGADACAFLHDAWAFVSSGTCTGGEGGLAANGVSGIGGHGIHARTSGLRLLDATTVGGGSPGGAPSAGLDSTPVATVFAGTARHLHVNPVMHEHSFVPMRFTGEPGELVTLIVSSRASFTASDSMRGALLVPARTGRARSVAVGQIAGNGMLDFAFNVGDLGPGVESSRATFQPVFVSSSQQRTLGPACSMILLDSAF